MKILSLNQALGAEGLVEIITTLRAGGLCVFPSDTVYALLADASNTAALQKLFLFKDRLPGRPVSVFVRDIDEIKRVGVITPEQETRIRSILPGPYTVVVLARSLLPRELQSQSGAIGVRIPEYPPLRVIVSSFGGPLTATSAHLAGGSPHYSARSFLIRLPEYKRGLIDLLVDGGRLPRNKPSTVVDLTGESMDILRLGGELPSEKQSIISHSEDETKEIAQQAFRTFGSVEKPLIFLLQGDLGTGKTVFARGIAEELGINDVISPTYVVHYEYNVPQPAPYQTFNHYDLYAIQDQEEFRHIGFEEALKPRTVHIIEWGEKLGWLYDSFKKKAVIVIVRIEHVSETMRKFTITPAQ